MINKYNEPHQISCGFRPYINCLIKKCNKSSYSHSKNTIFELLQRNYMPPYRAFYLRTFQVIW